MNLAKPKLQTLTQKKVEDEQMLLFKIQLFQLPHAVIEALLMVFNTQVPIIAEKGKTNRNFLFNLKKNRNLQISFWPQKKT